MEIDYKAIGNRIKNKRLEKNLTQEELGKKVEISGKYIGTIVKKQRNSKSLNSYVCIPVGQSI